MNFKTIALIAPALLLVACGPENPVPTPEAPATEAPAEETDRPCGGAGQIDAEQNCKPQ